MLPCVWRQPCSPPMQPDTMRILSHSSQYRFMRPLHEVVFVRPVATFVKIVALRCATNISTSTAVLRPCPTSMPARAEAFAFLYEQPM